MSGLRGIYISSNVTKEGKPFCQITLQHEDDDEALLPDAVGQLDPRRVKEMALDWITAAEAAIHDAAVYRMLVDKIGLDDPQAAMVLADLRTHRIDADDMTEPPE